MYVYIKSLKEPIVVLKELRERGCGNFLDVDIVNQKILDAYTNVDQIIQSLQTVFAALLLLVSVVRFCDR